MNGSIGQITPGVGPGGFASGETAPSKNTTLFNPNKGAEPEAEWDSEEEAEPGVEADGYSFPPILGGGEVLGLTAEQWRGVAMWSAIGLAGGLLVKAVTSGAKKGKRGK